MISFQIDILCMCVYVYLFPLWNFVCVCVCACVLEMEKLIMGHQLIMPVMRWVLSDLSSHNIVHTLQVSILRW